jgi:hypothetical protein
VDIKIKVTVSGVDSYRCTRCFKTLKGAQKFAQNAVGEHPDCDDGLSAVALDGIVKVTVRGCTLTDLFPPKVEPKSLGICTCCHQRDATKIVEDNEEVWEAFCDECLVDQTAAWKEAIAQQEQAKAESNSRQSPQNPDCIPF